MTRIWLLAVNRQISQMSTTLTIYTKASTAAAWGPLALVQYLTDEFALGAGLTTEFEAEHAEGLACELKSEG